MDGEKEENEAKNETEEEVAADLSNQEDISLITVHGHEGVRAEMVASDHDEDIVTGTKEAATSEPEGLAVDITDQPVSHKEGGVLEINSNRDNETPGLNVRTPEGEEDISASQEEQNKAEAEEPTAASVDEEDITHEEYVRLFKQLSEEKDKASQHNSQLHTKLATFFSKKAPDDGHLEKEQPVWEQRQEYDKNIQILSELKQQFSAESGKAQKRAEELGLICQEKLDKVENEWRALVVLKREVAVSVLSRRLGKNTAQAKVESILAAEEHRQGELKNLRLKNIKLKMKVQKLEAALREEEQARQDPLEVQFEQLHVERLEMKKQAVKQSEESKKLQIKMRSGLEVLTNVKEKLFWSQVEVQARREELAEVETTVARKRDLLSRTKQARSSLQRDNHRLSEQRGLLGNRPLLQDFEDTVDASEYLEEQLENLKATEAEIVSRCGKWQKKPETTE